MIEYIIKYVQDQGFTVIVLPGRLIIEKTITKDGNELICGFDWAISPYDLKALPFHYFQFLADLKIAALKMALTS